MAKTKIRKGKLSVKEKDIDKALKESRTKRKQKKIRLYTLFAILILLFLVMKYWESSEKQEIRELSMDATPSIRADETSPNIAVGDTMGDVLDRGTKCRNHEYVLSPGVAELLKFEIKIQRELLELPHLLKNKFGREDLSIESSFENWEDLGITAEIDSFDIEPLKNKTNVWIAETGELLEAIRKTAETAGSGASGRIENITGFIAKTTRFKVDFYNDYAGVISSLGRYYYSEEKVGELAKSDISSRLGGSLFLNYNYEGKEYQMPVMKKEIEKSVYYLNCTLRISLPGDITEGIQGIESHLSIKIREEEDTKIALKFSYNKEKNEYYITGPAIAADCYKPGAAQ